MTSLQIPAAAGRPSRPTPRRLIPVGVVFYDGPSQLIGQEDTDVVAIATCLQRHSANPKTGDMVQCFILPRDINPVEAMKSGQDASVCGQCPQRHALGGGCYVVVHNAPRSVWDAYNSRALYPEREPEEVAELIAGRAVRLGAYGDPAAVPFEVWEALISRAKGHTGYTHQWRTCDPRFKRIVMASCDNFADHREAKTAGWRTFMVLGKGPVGHAGVFGDAPSLKEERFVLCPASEGAGHLLTCAECLHCCGTGSGRVSDVYIPVHGFRSMHFKDNMTTGSSG